MNKEKILIPPLLILFLICSLQVSAQNLSNYQWIYGANTDFQSFDYETKKSKLNTEGLGITNYGAKQSLTVNDPHSGTLLFYTDGQKIYDGNHNIMPNGDVIEGDNRLLYGVTALQSATNDSGYGLFSVNGNNLYYTFIDMSLRGSSPLPAMPLGDVSTVAKNLIVNGDSPAEVILPIVSASRRENFLLGQNRTNNELFVYSVNSSHQFTRVATFSLDFTISSADAFEVSGSQIRIALAPKDLLKNIVTIDFDMDTSSFIATSLSMLNNTGVDNGSTEYGIYAVQFSPSGENLYFSVFGNDATNVTGSVLKYNFDSASLTSILTANVYRSYGLKTGSDNAIYHLYQITLASDTTIGVIQQPDGVGNNVDYIKNAFVGKRATGTVFPQTVLSQKNTPLNTALDFEVYGSCEKKNILFSPTYPADNIPVAFSWDFGDGNTSKKHIPMHVYSAAGNYEVKLILTFVSGEKREVVKMVNIATDTNEFQLPEDTTLCVGETLTLDAKSSTAIWNTGATGQTLVVDKPGTYYAIVGNSGCIAYDEIKVKYYGDENKVANIWHFGSKAGIDFNQSPPVTSSNSNVDAPAGVATMSDENGDLLFYTNGETVWDKEHNVMPNGNAIGGQKESSQSAIILPVSEDNTLFYIFTTKEVYGDGTNVLGYSLVDIKLNSFKGDVVVKNKVLFSRSTERVAANTSDGNTWLIAHEFGNNVFRSYQLSKDGLSSAVKSNIGSSHDILNPVNGKGYIKFNSKSDQVAITSPTNNKVEIFDFDTKKGTLDNLKTLDIQPVATNGYPYGLAWTPNGNKLFVSVVNDNVVQEWLVTGNEARKIGDIPISGDVGALQIGPDGRIYVAKNNVASLGTIQVSADDNTLSTYNDEGIRLSTGSTGGLGLPNFIQNLASPPTEPEFTVSNACAGIMASFSATGTSDIDVFNWDFGDGGKSSEQNPMHTYSVAGNYTVTLSISNKCGYIKVLNKDIGVGTPPNVPDTETINLCNPTQTITAGTNLDPTWTYDWTFPNGAKATASSVDISLPGTYRVTVSSPEGCNKMIEKNVINIRPTIDLGADRNICLNEIAILDAQNPTASSFVWRKNGVIIPGAVNQTLSVDTQMVERAIYEVTVTLTNGSLSCSSSDEINVSVIAIPEILNVISTPTSSCGISNGSISFNIVASGGTFTYRLALATTEVTNETGVNADAYVIHNLASGSYSLTVINESTGCKTVSNQIGISDTGGFIAEPILPLDFSSCLVAENGNKVVFNMRDSDNNPLDIYDNIWLSGPIGFEGFQTRIIGGDGRQLQKDTDYFTSTDPKNSQFIVAGLTEGTYAVTFTSPSTAEATTSVTTGGVTQDIITTPLRPSACTTSVNITLTNTAEKLDVEVFSVNDAATANAVACQPIGLSVQFRNGSTPQAKEIDADLFKFEWTSLTGTFDASTRFKEVGVVSKGTHLYNVRVEDRSGVRCPGEDFILATLLDPLGFEIRQNESQKGCDGRMELTAIINNAIVGETFIYEWTQVDGTTRTKVGSVSTLVLDTSSLDVPEIRNYQLNITSNLRGSTCITPVSKQVTLLPELIVKMTNSLACDDGLPFQINTFINRNDLSNMIFKWKLDGQPINQTTKSIAVDQGGLYELEVLEFRDLADNTPRCSIVTTLKVNVTPIPRITLPTEKITICPLDSNLQIKQVNINTVPEGFSLYTWSRGGNVISNNKDIIITSSGEYKIEAETVTGCISRAMIEVVEDCQPVIKTPTAFTPKINNMNDIFMIYTKYVTDFSISILNHWGEVIYTSDKKDFRWNGRYNGKILPAGSYNYIMEYSSELDKNKVKYSKQGGVVLVR